MEISLTPHNSDTTINTSAADENVNEKQTELLGDLNYFSPDARRAGLKPHPLSVITALGFCLTTSRKQLVFLGASLASS